MTCSRYDLRFHHLLVQARIIQGHPNLISYGGQELDLVGGVIPEALADQDHHPEDARFGNERRAGDGLDMLMTEDRDQGGDGVLVSPNDHRSLRLCDLTRYPFAGFQCSDLLCQALRDPLMMPESELAVRLKQRNGARLYAEDLAHLRQGFPHHILKIKRTADGLGDGVYSREVSSTTFSLGVCRL